MWQRCKVGDLHLMNPTSFFHVVGYMMFVFSYYSFLTADSNPQFLKRLGYFYARLQIRWSARSRVSAGIAQTSFPELKIFELVFG